MQTPTWSLVILGQVNLHCTWGYSTNYFVGTLPHDLVWWVEFQFQLLINQIQEHL
jgi:hypothetical protein